MVTVAETREFIRRIDGLMDQTDKDALLFYLACHPEAGSLIRGTGGLRKLRWNAGGKGKRGGARVIYYFHSEKMPLYLLTAYGKSEKSDLSAVHRRELSKLTDMLRKCNGL